MPAVSVLIRDWSRSDVELRSKLIFNSISDQVALYLADKNDAALLAFFERLTDDEKLLGLGFCDTSGRLRAATKLMPASITCDKLARTEFAELLDHHDRWPQYLRRVVSPFRQKRQRSRRYLA